MSQGATIRKVQQTDDSGNAAEVELRDGRYMMAVRASETDAVLARILATLERIERQLNGRR